MKLSIIIVSYNTRDITKQCIASIRSAEWKDRYEIIVVDNNSTDGSVEMLYKFFPEVKVIANKDNRLFSIANNQGAAIAQGEYLLLLNSDTIIYEDNLQKMINFIESCSDDVICVGPKVLNADKTLQSCGVPPEHTRLEYNLVQYSIDKILPLRFLMSAFDRRSNVTHTTGWVSGCCMLIPAKKYADVGGLNENLIFYGEEPEFSYRTRKLGYKTIYYSDASIIHLGGASTKTQTKEEMEKGFKRFSALIEQTIGYDTAISRAKDRIRALRLKRIFYTNKSYIDECIWHEKQTIERFGLLLKQKRS